MDLKSLTSIRMDEVELLMLIARHIQFDRAVFGEDYLVIHLDSDDDGMALISDVVRFSDARSCGAYYHSNGRTTLPAIIFRPDKDCISLMISAQKYFRIYKVYPGEIKLDYDAGRSVLESNRLGMTICSEEERHAMIQGAIGEFKSLLSNKPL
jgi:hypothetical protein